MKTNSLRGQVTKQSEEAIGKLAQELLENPVVTSALIGGVRDPRARDARPGGGDGGLNLPSASDLERLTRRVRSVSQRLEGIEDGLDRLDTRLERSDSSQSLEDRLTKIEAALERLEAVRAEASRGRRSRQRRSAQAQPPSRPAPRPLSEAGAPRAGGASPRSRAQLAARPPAARRRRSAVARARAGQRRSAPPRPRTAASGEREQRRGLHLHRERPARASSRLLARAVRRRRGRWKPPVPSRPRPPAASAALEQMPVGGDPPARAERPAGAVGGDRLGHDEQLAERERGRERAAGPDPDHAPRAEVVQLGDHDRGARAAHPGALDRQRLAVGGGARVAPQAAVVVEHPRRRRAAPRPGAAPGPGSPGSRTRSASGAVGWMWIGAHEVGELTPSGT